MTREEFIKLSIEFIESKDYLSLKKGSDFYNNIIVKAKECGLDKDYFGVTFMEQVISFRETPENYRELLESF